MTSQTSASSDGAQPSNTGEGERRAQTCAECGTRPAPGQSFCDGCGAVLSWTPQAATRTPERTASRGTVREDASGDSREPAHAPAPASATQPGHGPDHESDYGPDHESDQAPARVDDAARTEPVPAVGPDSAPADSSTEETAPTEPVPAAADARARALLIPVADPNQRVTTTPDVAPVLPGRPAAARPRAQGPGTEPDEEGGTPCPWCGTGNRPGRHFCRRCAMTLAGGPGGPAARRPPWWRRMLDFRNRPAPWAGDRPRLRRSLGRIVTLAVWGLVAALVVTGAFYADNAYQAARDHFAKRAPVAPDSVKASRSFRGHNPQLAFDKTNNTWWGPGVSQGGDGEWIEVQFQRPTRLLDILITPGISTRAADLSKSALPHRVEALITTADGRTTTRNLTLDQGAGSQRRSFRVGEVSAVRFILRSAHGAAADKQVSIAEIEFFGRSSGS
ncbi:discoidin domain-containing protein [Streptomyces sp. NPDC002668]|uniref:discoidin domain-containing protein n=1 Tax=Streptomyces sp. NPDC002668 TaxID=3154422 RepID=UPI003320707A